MWVLQREVECCDERDACCVGSCNEVEHEVRNNLRIVDHLWIFFFRFDEFVKEVRLLRVIVFGVVVLKPIYEMLDRDVRDRAERGRPKPVNGIFVKEVVEDWHLAYQ